MQVTKLTQQSYEEAYQRPQTSLFKVDPHKILNIETGKPDSKLCRTYVKRRSRKQKVTGVDQITQCEGSFQQPASKIIQPGCSTSSFNDFDKEKKERSNAFGLITLNVIHSHSRTGASDTFNAYPVSILSRGG